MQSNLIHKMYKVMAQSISCSDPSLWRGLLDRVETQPSVSSDWHGYVAKGENRMVRYPSTRNAKNFAQPSDSET